MLELRQSTAVTVKIGPFVDEDDGKTAETGLTIARADVRLSKNGGNMAQKNEATSCTHDEIGVYGCPLDVTDTGTLGRLQLFVHESGALPVWHEYEVVTQNYWDSKYSTDYLQVDTVQIEGTDATTVLDTQIDSRLNTAIGGAPTAGSIFERIKTMDDAALTLTGIADTVLKRDVANVEDAAGVDSLAALILARFHSAISGTTWTIKKTDDATTFDTYTITKSSTADPITSVADPA